MPRALVVSRYPVGNRGRSRRGAPALFLRAVVVFFVTLVLVGVEAELLRLEHRHQEILALGVVRLHELLVELVDELLELIVAQIDLQQQGAVHLEPSVVEIDPPDAARAAVDDEDLARLGADGPLETCRFHGRRSLESWGLRPPSPRGLSSPAWGLRCASG